MYDVKERGRPWRVSQHPLHGRNAVDDKCGVHRYRVWRSWSFIPRAALIRTPSFVLGAIHCLEEAHGDEDQIPRAFQPPLASNVRREDIDEAGMDDHWCSRRAPELQVVPVAAWSAGNGSRPRRLRASPRLGWNGLALSPRMGCPRASVADKPPLCQARQRPSLVFPGG
jgi:hypothetical protein